VPEHTPLPRSLLPLPGESLAGLLLRLAHRLDQRPVDIALHTGLTNGTREHLPANHLLMLAPQFRPVFTHVTKIPGQLIDDLTFCPLVTRYPPVAEALTRPGGSPQLRPRSYFPPGLLSASTRYCPLCLAGNGSEIQRRHGGAWKTEWRLAAAFVCIEHRLFLQDTCPACSIPAHGGSQKKLTLLASAATGGLHPAQCRNPRPGLPICGDRMDRSDHVSHTITPSAEVIALQQRIQDLLSPGHNRADSFAAFSDLQVLTAIIQATWPATATVTPEHRLASALDHHITAQRQHDPAALTHIRRSHLWVTPPLSAPATAGLMDIAARLIALPPPALHQAVGALAARIPLPTASGWGKTWSLLRRDSSPAFRTQMLEALPHPFRPGGTAPITAWRRSRQPILPVRDRGYLPEHVPQWLPDDWFTSMVLDSSRRATARSVTFRRFAAVQLVQMATGMQLDEAAQFLGIPDSWHQAPPELRKLHSHSRYRQREEHLPTALETLSQHAAKITNPVNYRARRLQFSDWTLSPEEWTAINTPLHRSSSLNHPPIPEIMIHACASIMVWTHLTGSERRLAPSILIHYPEAAPLDLESDQAKTIRWLIGPRGRPVGYYHDLREALLQHLATLTTTNGGSRADTQ
jgi:hypothetical protein